MLCIEKSGDNKEKKQMILKKVMVVFELKVPCQTEFTVHENSEF